MKYRWEREIGSTVEVEGVPFRVVAPGRELKPGDTYVAERNTGPVLLTVERIGRKLGCIIARERLAYPYDIGECYKVELVEG